jgi:hypothetical protein
MRQICTCGQCKVFAAGAGFLLLTSQLASFNIIWYSKYLYNVSKLERVSLDFPKESELLSFHLLFQVARLLLIIQRTQTISSTRLVVQNVEV